jgi:hypothetical protein
MGTTITIGKRHFAAASQKARELGMSPERYIESLIDADTMTFDEILGPVRESFAKGGATEEELDEAVNEARKGRGVKWMPGGGPTDGHPSAS